MMTATREVDVEVSDAGAIRLSIPGGHAELDAGALEALMLRLKLAGVQAKAAAHRPTVRYQQRLPYRDD